MTRKIAVTAALLLGAMSFAHAQGTMGRGSVGGSAGASQYSPGHEMRSGTDTDDRGPGASGFSPGHEMKGRGTVGQSRGGRGDVDRDRDRGGRQSFDRDRDEHRTIGESRGGRGFGRDRDDRSVGRDRDDRSLGRGDRDRGASELSPGSRMREGGDIDRR